MKQCCQSVQQIAAIDWCAVSPIKMSSPPLALMHALNRFLKFLSVNGILMHSSTEVLLLAVKYSQGVACTSGEDKA